MRLDTLIDEVTSSVNEIKELHMRCTVAYEEVRQMFDDRVVKGEASVFDDAVWSEVNRMFTIAMEDAKPTCDRARDVILCRMIAKLLHHVMNDDNEAGAQGASDVATLVENEMSALEALRIEMVDHYALALSVIEEAKKWCRNEENDYFKVSFTFRAT